MNRDNGFSVWAISRFALEQGILLGAQYYRPLPASTAPLESTIYVPSLGFGLYSGMA